MKNEFRVINQAENHSLVNLVVTIANLSNNGQEKVTLKDLESYCKCHILGCPLTLSKVRVIVVDHILFIEDNMEQVLELREIELHELKMDDAPTLDKYTEPSY